MFCRILDDTSAVSSHCAPHAISKFAHNTPRRRGSQYSIPLSRQLARIPCRRIGSRHALHAVGVGGQYHRFRASGNLFHTSSSEAVCIHARSASMTENQGIAGSSFFLRAQKRRVRLKSTRHLIFYANRSKALRKSGKAAY